MIEWSHSSWQKHSSICTCCLIQIQISIFCRRCVIYLLHKTSHLLLPLILEPFLANSTYSTQKRTLSRFLINKGAVLSLKQNWKSWVYYRTALGKHIWWLEMPGAETLDYIIYALNTLNGISLIIAASVGEDVAIGWNTLFIWSRVENGCTCYIYGASTT